MPPITGEDFVVVGTLIILEGLLSADNALVLAMQVRHLPEEQRKKALLYGLIGAFVLRGLGIVTARHIVQLWWLCALGAGYLLFLCIRHFLQRESHADGTRSAPTGPGFWQTVVMVELTDIVFAVDSILVAVAFSNKLWVIYAGAFLGIILLRLAATFFIRLLERYPSLDDMAYALVGWAGVKLMASAIELFLVTSERYTESTVPHFLPKWLFWTVMALIVVVGSLHAVRHKRSEAECVDSVYDEAVEDLAGSAPFGGR